MATADHYQPMIATSASVMDSSNTAAHINQRTVRAAAALITS